MNPDRARQLLGGLAAGILSPEERRTLFDAALHDQVLFNEVADELEFAAFLQSPEARAQLAGRIEVQIDAEPERRPWWTLRPRWLALSGVLAASVIVFVAIWHRPVEVPHESVAAPPRVTAPAQTAPVPAAPVPAPARSAESPAPPASAPEPKAIVPQPKASPPPAAKRVFLTQSIPPAKPKPEPVAAPERFAAPMARAAPAPAMPPPPPASTASLTGTVRDAGGTPVPGAQVEIVNGSTNTMTHATSDPNGRFVAASLPPGGPYTVTAVAPGFEKKRQSGITLAENQPTEVDIPLQVGSVSETVAVAAAAPALPAPQNLTQVAVLDFANSSEQRQSGAQAADLLSNQLGNSGQVRVVDRAKVQQALQDRNANGHSPNAQEAAALGRSVGADAVIMGSVQSSGTVGRVAAPGGVAMAPQAAPKVVSVTAEIIDTKQARPLGKVTAGGASLQRATASVGNQIQSRLAKPAAGSVTRVNGEMVSVRFDESPIPQAGARCDILRGTAKIGEIVITSESGQDAMGKFSGTGRPRAGDRITASR